MRPLRKLIATLFLFCWAGVAVVAQDVIVKTDQSTIISKVLEVTSTEIKYKKWSNQEGPTYSVELSEVLSITYQNGEVDNFVETSTQQRNNQQYQQPHQQQPQHPSPMQDYVSVGGYMEADGGYGVKLNGNKISDEEVRRLVDEQTYQIYLKGKRKRSANVFYALGSLASAAGAGVFYATGKKGAGIVFTVISGIGVICWTFIDGSKEMKEVASIYNMRQGNYYSFSISPFLMPIELPQMQNSHALGLTLNVNF